MRPRSSGALTVRSSRRPAFILVAALVCAVTAGAPASASSPAASTCPSYNPPDELVLTAGTPQSAMLGSVFATGLSVGVAASNGCPITTPLAGIAVTFSAPSSGPSGTFSASGSNAALVGTNAAGEATAPMFTANSLAGGYLVVASSEVGSVSFSLVNTAQGVPAAIAAVTPARESATVSNRYPQPLRARVLDATGAPVAGAAVTFRIGAAGGGSGAGAASAGAVFLDGASEVTEATGVDGVATSTPLVANASPGRFTATATVAGSGAVATFALTNLAGAPLRIGIVGGARRSTTVDHGYPRPLRVRVRTAHGAPLQGATVTFAAVSGSGNAGASSSGGPGATFAGGAAEVTATTDANGVATAPRLVANGVAGTFKATATTTGATTAATFTLRNLAKAPAAVTGGAGSGQTTSVGSRFAIPLAVTVKDADGNVVPGVVVTFTAPARGPSGRFAGGRRAVRVPTGGDGIAVAPRFTANERPGGYVVTATVGRTHERAAFALVNLAGTEG